MSEQFQENRLPEEKVAIADLIVIFPLPLKSILVINTIATDENDRVLVIPKSRFLSDEQILGVGNILAHSENQELKLEYSSFIMNKLYVELKRSLFIDSGTSMALVADSVPMAEFSKESPWMVAASRIKGLKAQADFEEAKRRFMVEERELMISLLSSNDKNRVRTIWSRRL